MVETPIYFYLRPIWKYVYILNNENTKLKGLQNNNTVTQNLVTSWFDYDTDVKFTTFLIEYTALSNNSNGYIYEEEYYIFY